MEDGIRVEFGHIKYIDEDGNGNNAERPCYDLFTGEQKTWTRPQMVAIHSSMVIHSICKYIFVYALTLALAFHFFNHSPSFQKTDPDHILPFLVFIF